MPSGAFALHRRKCVQAAAKAGWLLGADAHCAPVVASFRWRFAQLCRSFACPACLHRYRAAQLALHRMQVKVICSSGGRFMRTAGGGFEYEGGETRLVGITNFCSYRTLVDSLERVTGTVAPAWGGSDKSDAVSSQILAHRQANCRASILPMAPMRGSCSGWEHQCVTSSLAC